MDMWLSDGGWRMPIRPGGVLELFQGSSLCAQVDAAVLVDALAIHVRVARLVSLMQRAGPDPLSMERLVLIEGDRPAAIASTDAQPQSKPLAAPLPSRAQRALRRRSRKR